MVSLPPQEGAVCLCDLSRPGWGLPKGFALTEGEKRWKEGGKTNFYFYFFGPSGKAEGQGTVGEGGTSLCLNYYAKNKTNKKKQLALLPLWKVGPLPDSRFSPGAEREAEARAISLTASKSEH